MRRLRRLAVFPIELLLGALVCIYVASEAACRGLGWICQQIEGPH